MEQHGISPEDQKDRMYDLLISGASLEALNIAKSEFEVLEAKGLLNEFDRNIFKKIKSQLNKIQTQ